MTFDRPRDKLTDPHWLFYTFWEWRLSVTDGFPSLVSIKLKVVSHFRFILHYITSNCPRNSVEIILELHFNMRHVKHIEIIIWYLAEHFPEQLEQHFPSKENSSCLTHRNNCLVYSWHSPELPLAPPKRIVQIRQAVLTNKAYRQRDIQNTHFDFICMIKRIINNNVPNKIFNTFLCCM